MTETAEQKAYDHLRRKLFLGELSPGQRVSAVATAREIGASPTPVTQAIRRLEIEGLIDLVPHFGTFVKKPDLRDIEHLYDLRLALETHAVARAAGKLAPESLAELDACCQTTEQCAARCAKLAAGARVEPALLRQASLADLKLHTIIVRASRNPRIIKLLEDSQVLMRGMTLFPNQTAAYWTGNLRDGARDHRAIVDAVRRGDRKAARRAMSKHLRDSIIEARERFRIATRDARSAGASSVYDVLRQAETPTSAPRSRNMRKARGE